MKHPNPGPSPERTGAGMAALLALRHLRLSVHDSGTADACQFLSNRNTGPLVDDTQETTNTALEGKLETKTEYLSHTSRSRFRWEKTYRPPSFFPRRWEEGATSGEPYQKFKMPG